MAATAFVSCSAFHCDGAIDPLARCAGRYMNHGAPKGAPMGSTHDRRRTADPSEAEGVCVIAGANGRMLRTSSFEDSPAGCSWVEARDADGNVLGFWTVDQWGC